MFSPSKTRAVFRYATGMLALALLISCAPTQPEGIDTEGFARIGDQLHARGDDVTAGDFYMRGIQHAPGDIRIRKSYAGILESRGDLAGASAQYSAALQIAPDDPELLRSYGRVLIKLGRPDEAREEYEQALRIDSRDVKSLNGLGVALDLLNDHTAAQKVYQEALDDKPDDLVTLGNLGHSYVLSGAWDDAIRLLEPHCNDKDATPAFRQNLAEAYGMAGMDADAERVSRMDLSAEQVKRNLAYYRAHRGRLVHVAALTADLGSFATQALAEVHADEVKSRFPQETADLTIAVTPEVKTIGGTPVFSVRATGFGKMAGLRAFCGKLKQEGMACLTRSEI